MNKKKCPICKSAKTKKMVNVKVCNYTNALHVVTSFAQDILS